MLNIIISPNLTKTNKEQDRADIMKSNNMLHHLINWFILYIFMTHQIPSLKYKRDRQRVSPALVLRGVEDVENVAS